MSAPQAMLILIPALPLAVGLLGLTASGRLGARICAALGSTSLLASAALAAGLYSAGGASLALPWLGMPDAFVAREGFRSGQLQVGFPLPFALHLGQAQIIFAVTCALVAAGVIAFALRERQGDPQAARFHALLTLFGGAMLGFLCADTLLVVYAAWEAMGIISYLLIAWPGTAAARRAARQAFWTTRLTDFGLLFAVLILLTMFHWPTLSSINVAEYMQGLAQQSSDPLADLRTGFAWIGAAALLVTFAVIGKCAQWPLSFWLAEAMRAPAPVSALLHAAAMVAAGPHLLFMLRVMLFPRQIQLDAGGGQAPLYFAPVAALGAMALIGAATSLLCGLMAFHAREPKRILAYSTASQLGLTILASGLLAEKAGYFLLIAHAWSKAALFICVGALAAKWHSQQALPSSEAPGLWALAGSARGQKLLLAAMLLAAASLGGIPLLGAGLGKEQIFWAAWTRGDADPGFHATLGAALPGLALCWSAAALMLLLSLPLTAAYLTRLVVTLGWGGTRGAEEAHSGRGWRLSGAVALGFAVLGSLGASLAYKTAYFRIFTDASASWQWMPEKAAGAVWTAAAFLLSAAGAVLGLRSAARGAQARESAFAAYFAEGMRLEPFWRRVVGAPGWIAAVWAARNDRQVIDGLVVGTGRFGRWLSGLAHWADLHIVDGARYWGCEVWWIVRRAHQRLLQTGYIQHYMFVVLLGAVVLCFVILRPLADIFGKIMGAI